MRCDLNWSRDVDTYELPRIASRKLNEPFPPPVCLAPRSRMQLQPPSDNARERGKVIATQALGFYYFICLVGNLIFAMSFAGNLILLTGSSLHFVHCCVRAIIAFSTQDKIRN